MRNIRPIISSGRALICEHKGAQRSVCSGDWVQIVCNEWVTPGRTRGFEDLGYCTCIQRIEWKGSKSCVLKPTTAPKKGRSSVHLHPENFPNVLKTVQILGKMYNSHHENVPCWCCRSKPAEVRMCEQAKVFRVMAVHLLRQ